MALYKDEGIVIRERPLGEADKLLTILTRKGGKMAASARGARRTRNRLLGPTQLFCHSRFLLLTGRGLATVGQAEIIEPFVGLREDLERLAYASYFAELVDGFMGEDDSQPAIFDFLRSLFSGLLKVQDLDLLVRYGELKLVSLAGFMPSLFRCASCGETLPLQVTRAAFSPDAGGLLCSGCSSGQDLIFLKGSSVAALRHMLTADPKRVSVLAMNEDVRGELKYALRRYLDYYLGKDLKSLDFLAALEGGG
jgi:DNA repair protein RecO (recombination protein O)